jgi:phosphoribosyl 1,2-cyclic phosphodiesterase/CheY-like chemotaxis protein
MANRTRFAIVDDSLASATLAKALLEEAGHEATIYTSPEEGLEAVSRDAPDCVLLDILMPGIDGFEMCSRLRAMHGPERLRIVMCTSKSFEFDRRRAAEMGADGYIVKPIRKEPFFEAINKVMASKVELTFWGVRGTLPRPGRDSVRYGGNTSCVAVEFPRGQLFVFDAGSGIKRLGDHLMTRGKRLEGKIFISHPHWDHINTLPFFTPLYVPGNEFEILGSSHGPTTMKDLVSAQMDGVYFPITMREFGAKVDFRDLHEGSFPFGEITVDTMLLAHPGNCLGYRVRYDGRTICYITDNELFRASSEYFSEEYEERLLEFVRKASVLIMDTNYFDEEYETKVGWGHSCVSQVADFAHRAEAQTLYLFHHDPNHDDDAIDHKVGIARDLLRARGSSTRCVSPQEGEVIRL